MRAAGRHTVPPLILKRVRRPPPDPDSTSQTRQPPSTMRPASLCRPGNRRPPCDQPHLAAPAIAVHHATSPPCRPGNRRPPCDQPHLAAPAIAVHHATSPPCRPGNRRPPVMPPFSIQAQPLPHGAGGPHAKQTVVSRPRRPSTAKRGRGDSRKGPQLAGGGLRREGVAEGRGCRGKGSRRGGVQSEGPQPYPAWACGESGGVFSRALYHLQA